MKAWHLFSDEILLTRLNLLPVLMTIKALHASEHPICETLAALIYMQNDSRPALTLRFHFDLDPRSNL